MTQKIPEKTKRARVLLVDDKPENLRLLAEMLAERDYVVQIALSGEQALRAVGDRLPDIILLDVNMPGMDGFEVCRRLKEQPKTEPIPLIFITALARTEEKVRGLQYGAVDYVTKPFQLEEVAARLQTHLELKRLRGALANKVDELEEKNGRLSLFADALAHDLRNPLAGVMGLTETLLRSDSMIEDEPREYIRLVHKSAQRMNRIVEALLLLATAENGESHSNRIDVEDAFQSARQGLAPMINRSETKIHQVEGLPAALGNAAWVERIWTNYLSNAIKYGGSPPEITVGANAGPDGQMQYWIEDNGPGLEPEQMKRLFTPFSRLHTNKAEGIGLGLVIVQKIVEQMGGSAGVDKGSLGGSRFFFTLPFATDIGSSHDLAPTQTPLHAF